MDTSVREAPQVQGFANETRLGRPCRAFSLLSLSPSHVALIVRACVINQRLRLLGSSGGTDGNGLSPRRGGG